MNSVIYNFRRKLQVLAYDVFGAEIMSKLYFLIVLKHRLNLANPKTFNEKIQWYKLFYCPQNSDVILCTDKYRIREYLKQKGLLDYAVPLISVWNNPREIKWENLPDRFVIKANHGCAYNIVCSDRTKFNVIEANKKLCKWIREDFGKYNAEPHYSHIKPVIICEEFLHDEDSSFLTDYKVHCFNGKPCFTLVCSDREQNHACYDYYNNSWEKLNYSTTKNKVFERPKFFEKMISVSEIIAKDFPFVRVDFYETKEKLFIGELTFVPAGGLDNTITYEADVEIGKMLVLPR